MKKQNILLLGAGGHALSCIDVIESHREFKIQGLLGTKEEIGKKILGYEVLGDNNYLQEISNHEISSIVAVGQIYSPNIRIQLFELLVNLNFRIPAIISPNAIVSKHSSIGKGTIVMPGVEIGPNVNIGENCIINTNVVIEHDSIIGNHSHIATGAILNGNVKIGKGSFIGSGAIIRNNLTIGELSFISMGLRIVRNVEDFSRIRMEQNEN